MAKYLNRPLTVRLPDYLREILEEIATKERMPVSDIVREAVRRHVSIYRFRKLRGRVLPFAESQGLLTDEDVFRDLS
jgi:Arc/MetJ-type ribon-helix-helix transcriptional regulator